MVLGNAGSDVQFDELRDIILSLLQLLETHLVIESSLQFAIFLKAYLPEILNKVQSTANPHEMIISMRYKASDEENPSGNAVDLPDPKVERIQVKYCGTESQCLKDYEEVGTRYSGMLLYIYRKEGDQGFDTIVC